MLDQTKQVTYKGCMCVYVCLSIIHILDVYLIQMDKTVEKKTFHKDNLFSHDVVIIHRPSHSSTNVINYSAGSVEHIPMVLYIIAYQKPLFKY